jgi:hypothetical protein
MAEVKEALECRRPGAESSLRLLLFEDGSIKCCSVNATGQSRCCYTSPPDYSEDYGEWVRTLTHQGYEIKPLDKSTVVVPKTDYEALRERVKGSMHGATAVKEL